MLTDEQIATATKAQLEHDLSRIRRELDRRKPSNVIDARAWPTPSDVIAGRPHADGWLQLERRWYVGKDGHRTLRGPYWYFRYHEDGKQKKIYLGKTDDPEGKLAEKRGKMIGEV
jgi:hypothetical protein